MKNELTRVVRAVRLRHALLFVIVLVAAYLAVIRPWMTDWGSTAAEQALSLPGDEFLPEGAATSTYAVTIDAPPEVVWQWLAQVGQDRAGLYSYTWLENLVGADIHNADELHPEWQNVAVGGGWRLVPADYMGGVGANAVDPILLVQPGRALVLKMFGAQVVQPTGENATRFIVRGQEIQGDVMSTMLVAPLVFTMERRMMLGLKEHAEGRPEASAPLMALANLGWLAAGCAVAWLFVSDRRRLPWLALPLAVAAFPLVTTADWQAALAAFLAVGISALGFLVFGRSWLASLMIMGSLVMLVLLLAPNAYFVLALAFAVVLLAAVGGAIADRSSRQRVRTGADETRVVVS